MSIVIFSSNETPTLRYSDKNSMEYKTFIKKIEYNASKAESKLYLCI
jgi:hypothetical protein